MRLKVVLKGDSKVAGNIRYHTEINAENFKELSLLFSDLKKQGVPIEKAIKEHRIRNSFWDSTLGG